MNRSVVQRPKIILTNNIELFKSAFLKVKYQLKGQILILISFYPLGAIICIYLIHIFIILNLSKKKNRNSECVFFKTNKIKQIR